MTKDHQIKILKEEVQLYKNDWKAMKFFATQYAKELGRLRRRSYILWKRAVKAEKKLDEINRKQNRF